MCVLLAKEGSLFRPAKDQRQDTVVLSAPPQSWGGVLLGVLPWLTNRLRFWDLGFCSEL